MLSCSYVRVAAIRLASNVGNSCCLRTFNSFVTGGEQMQSKTSFDFDIASVVRAISSGLGFMPIGEAFASMSTSSRPAMADMQRLQANAYQDKHSNAIGAIDEVLVIVSSGNSSLARLH